MLAKKARLNSVQFEQVIQAGKTVGGRLYSLRALRTKKRARFAVAPSSRIKGSVQKRKVKRDIFNVLRTLAPEVQNYDVIVFVKGPLPFREPRRHQELEILLKKLK